MNVGSLYAFIFFFALAFSYLFPIEGLVTEAVPRDAAGRSPIYRDSDTFE